MMQNPLKYCTSLLRSLAGPLSRSFNSKTLLPAVINRGIHCSAVCRKEYDPDTPAAFKLSHPPNWLKYNNVIYPPQKEGEPRRPAEVCHMKTHQKYSTDKLWYIAKMIRGMTIDEAIKQLSFDKHKGAKIIKETLLEAQEMAVRDHNVEFKSNLWIESSFSGRGKIVKGLRKGRGPKYSIIFYRYSHYFVRLREGTPPKHYYPPKETGYEKMESYIKEQRSRRIKFDL